MCPQGAQVKSSTPPSIREPEDVFRCNIVRLPISDPMRGASGRLKSHRLLRGPLRVTTRHVTGKHYFQGLGMVMLILSLSSNSYMSAESSSQVFDSFTHQRLFYPGPGMANDTLSMEAYPSAAGPATTQYDFPSQMTSQVRTSHSP